jgi:hypothetical protein
MSKDFTLEKYRQICQAIIAAEYPVLTLNDFLLNKTTRGIVLRHDVDRRPSTSLRMAKIEHELGLQATYYFRHTEAVFKKSIITDITNLGHEIGYHYETLSKTHGNFHKAYKLFILELADFRTIYNVKTISMHGRPLSRWDNRTLWTHYSFHDSGITGEAYLSLDYNSVAYYSDTGRTWDNKKYNMRDQVSGVSPDHIDCSDQLATLIRTKRYPQICILTHPNRWSDTKMEWVASFLSDMVVNFTKKCIISLLKLKGKGFRL